VVKDRTRNLISRIHLSNPTGIQVSYGVSVMAIVVLLLGLFRINGNSDWYSDNNGIGHFEGLAIKKILK
jgi:hypothetical protein